MCVNTHCHSCVSRDIAFYNIVCAMTHTCVSRHIHVCIQTVSFMCVKTDSTTHCVRWLIPVCRDTFMCTWTHCTLNRLWTHRVHTATHCNTLQHTATHCNTLQHEQTSKTSCTQTNYTHFHTDTDCLTTSKKLSVVCCKSKDRVTLLSISIILWIHFVLVIAGWGGLLQMLQLLPVA